MFITPEGGQDDKGFGRWKQEHIYSGNLPEEKDEQAAMWAAEDPERFFEARLSHPLVRTVRGLHAKWKEARDQAEAKQSGEPVKAPDMGPSLADLRSVVKLRAVINHPNTGAPERAAAQRREGVRIVCPENLRP